MKVAVSVSSSCPFTGKLYGYNEPVIVDVDELDSVVADIVCKHEEAALTEAGTREDVLAVINADVPEEEAYTGDDIIREYFSVNAEGVYAELNPCYITHANLPKYAGFFNFEIMVEEAE